MIVRGVLLGLVLLTVLLLQTVVAPAMTIGGIAPDFVALTVLVLAVVEGPGSGLRYGFVGGLAVDLLAATDTIVGASALVFLLGGYAAGLTRPYIAGNPFAGAVLVAGIGTAVLVAMRVLLGFVLGVQSATPLTVLVDAALTGVYGAVLSPIAWFVLRRLLGLVSTSSG
ncbi:rod shape-determining protein MreD [Egibacter rhizosphaerae]|uniref:Rod shape-determining protein MreD n=1 Tax=Egibacter rhizosphaerae TaxID=1670831 RepID=A0A411YBQ9_9ACTN|nr:rod shape-determining protein MreD [Egibacter rhizosphaerae]QBI18661.1 rod shape-determining protein MreD [Egibacter rhizosphaerae]